MQTFPKPSVSATTICMALGPRGAVAYHPPRGPSTVPLSARYLNLRRHIPHRSSAMTGRNAQCTLAVALLFCTSGAQAEVIDKIASIERLWITDAVIATVAAAVTYALAVRVAPAALMTILAGAFAWPPLIPAEFLPEAMAHYGPLYAAHAQAAALLVPIAVIAAFGLRRLALGRAGQKSAACPSVNATADGMAPDAPRRVHVSRLATAEREDQSRKVARHHDS